MIQVGHTNVKLRGQKNSNSHFPLKSLRLIYLKPFECASKELPLKNGATLPTAARIAVVAILDTIQNYIIMNKIKQTCICTDSQFIIKYINKIRMSQNSVKHSSSSNSSAASLQRCVDKLLVTSQYNQKKNQQRLSILRNQFPVLKKIQNTVTNYQKLQMFLRDGHYKQKVYQKYMENNIALDQGVPVLKIYLLSTRFQVKIQEEFDQVDILGTFGKFGVICALYTNKTTAYILYQQPISVYCAMKIMDQFYISQKIRLRVRLCQEQESLYAFSMFWNRGNQNNINNNGNGTGNSNTNAHQRNNSNSQYQGNQPRLTVAGQEQASGCPSMNHSANKINQNLGSSPSHLKHIAKFEFQIPNLPQFNIAQRIIGPKGTYMKKIIQKVLNKTPLAHKYTLQNIDSVFKMRIRGKGSGFLENGQQSQQKIHLFISSKQKWMYQAACQEIQLLLIKILQDYKLAYQKIYRAYGKGLAYRILVYEGNCYTEVRQIYLQQIECTVDLISLQSTPNLSPKTIQQKITQREHARKIGKYQQADSIRNWLYVRGVQIIDSKVRRGKTTWNYIKL